MNRTDAISGAKRSLPADAGDMEITLEAMRRMGIDVAAEHHGRVIADYVRQQGFLFGLWESRGNGPMEFQKMHVITARQSFDGRAFFHF